MSPGEVSSKSRMAGRKLLNEIEWDRYDTISVFEPIKRLKEVDTTGIVSRLKSQGKKIHILSADKTASIPTQRFDLMIIPCLAFDKDNYRLGWGGGFYDKFLAGQPQALKIGLCFQNGFVEQGLPHESHDISLDRVITEI